MENVDKLIFCRFTEKAVNLQQNLKAKNYEYMFFELQNCNCRSKKEG